MVRPTLDDLKLERDGHLNYGKHPYGSGGKEPPAPPPAPPAPPDEEEPEPEPRSVPYNPDSETSRRSARKLERSRRNKEIENRLVPFVKAAGPRGVIDEEGVKALGIMHESLASKSSVLTKALDRLVVTDRQRRKSDTGNWCRVYVHMDHADAVFDRPLDPDEQRAKWALAGEDHPDGFPRPSMV